MADKGNDRSRFVYKDATVVVGTDEDNDITVVFLVMKGRSLAISFPRHQGSSKEITPEEMNVFFANTGPSEMLSAIKDAWWEKQGQ